MDVNKNKVLAENLRKPEGEFGEKVGEMMHKGNATFYKHLPEILLLNGREKILEVGMGAGYHVQDLLADLKEGHYVGIDYSATMVAVASAINKGLSNATFLLGNAEQLPFDASSFDRLFTINTVYFYDNPKAVFAEYYRVLRSGGKLIIGKRTVDDLKQMSAVTQYGFKYITKESILKSLETLGFFVDQVLLFDDPPAAWGDLNMNLHSEFIVATK